MKVKILSSIGLIIGLSAFTSFSISEKDMIGEWRIDDSSVPKTTQKVIDKLVVANPAIADQLEDNKEAIMDQINAIRLNMKADHTYESVTQQGSTGGKWNC